MSRPSTTAPVSDSSADSSSEQPFTGPLSDLDRLARVAVGTVVVVFTGEQAPTLRRPGDLLIPRLSPFGHRVATVPVTVQPVSLAVSVDGLGTSDGEVMEHVEVRVRVRFDPAEDHAVVTQLAAEHGPTFGDTLMGDVLRGVETAVRAAVGLNRSGDLRRQSLADLLTDHWMPPRLASNSLLVESLTVPVLRWPDSPQPDDTDPDSTEDTVEIAQREIAQEETAQEQITLAEIAPYEPLTSAYPQDPMLLLSDDARLRRRWGQRSEVGLYAVSTGRTTGARTAIAVVEASAVAAATRGAEEMVSDDDTLDAMLVVDGETYEEVVASWFTALAPDESRLVRVEIDDDLSRLTVHLAETRRLARHNVPFDPHAPAVDALRQLLPFDLVTFEGLS